MEIDEWENNPNPESEVYFPRARVVVCDPRDHLRQTEDLLIETRTENSQQEHQYAEKSPKTLVGGDDVNKMIIEERNREIKELEKDVEVVAETMGLIRVQLDNQGKQLDAADRLLGDADDDLEMAILALDGAATSKNNARARFWRVVGVAAGLVVAAVGTVVTVKSVTSSSQPH